MLTLLNAVSWNWGGGAPGGEVAEKKTEGEIAITSKRGNKIKKNAEPDNPAVHVKRSGNDVVKKASELNIEKKASGGGKDDSKKRKADEEEEEEKEEDKHEQNEDGKEIRKGGKTASKAGKGAKKAKKSEEPEEEQKEEPKEELKANGEKKGRGRPKAADVGGDKKTANKPKKSKKKVAPRQEGDLVSTRTRSQGKAK